MLLSLLRSSDPSFIDIVYCLFASLIVVFVCLPFSDFAQAWLAVKLGDNTPRYNGRLTINPLVHIDPIGAIMMVLVGFGFGKAVPYNPYNFKKPRRDILLIALSEPVSLLVFGLFFYILFEIVYSFILLQSAFVAFLAEALYIISYLNVGLAVFYLIPIPPLPGGRILWHFLPDRVVDRLSPYERYFPFGLMAFIISGALDYPLFYARLFFLNLFDLITFWM